MALLEARPSGRTAPSPRAVRLTKLGRIGADGCGDVELLAIATGTRLAQAALLLERLGGMQRASTATTHDPIRACLAPGRAPPPPAACEIARRGAAALPEGPGLVRP